MSARIGLVSDTHDDASYVRAAVAFFHQERPDLVLHLGDITSAETVRAFAGLPMRFLVGNNDVSDELAPALAREGFPELRLAWRAEVAGVRVGATHGHSPARLRELRGTCDVVLHGHTHKLRDDVEGGVLIVNPGALHRARVRTLAMLELPEKRVRFFEVRRSGVTPLQGPA